MGSRPLAKAPNSSLIRAHAPRPEVRATKAGPGGWGLLPGYSPSMASRSPLGGLLQLAAEVNVSSRVALGVSSRGTPILILKRCSTLLGHISLLSG